MAINQKANVEVTLNNEQAKKELEELQASMKKLSELRDKAFQEGNVTAFKAYDAELKKATRTAGAYKQQLFDVGKVMKNLSGSSMNDLRKAQAQLTAEVGRLDRATAQYSKRSADLKRVKTEIAAINNETAATQSRMSRMADGFNKYLGVGMSFIAGIAGISMTVKGAIQGFNDYEERVANLSSLTGLAGDDLKWLSDQARKLGTATLDGGVLVTNGSQAIVDAFTKVGSARPELLKDKEALAEVTKNAMILSSASKEELQPSIEALTMVMNQYNTAASEARRIINTIAAGSKEGAGEIPYITQAFEKAGTVAADAGLSIETLVATIETLAPRITQPEIAGRSLKGVLLDLQAGADDVNPAIVGMSTALENLGKKNLSITELTKMFGAENITTAKILINNVGELKRYEAAVTGTNVALEQGAINTNTNNARLAQAKERIKQVSDELGGKLAPIYASIVSKSSMLLKSIVTLVDFLIKYGRSIAIATAAIVGYTIAIKVAANWTKIQAAYTVTATAVERAYAFTKGVLTGQIKLATVAQKAWNLALKANPIGLIVGLIAGAIVWLIEWDKKTGKVSVALKKMGGYIIELANYFIELYNSSLPIRVAIQYMVGVWKTGFEAVILVVKSLWEQLKLGGKLLKAVFTFDFKGIKEALSDFAENSKKNVADSAKNVAETWETAYNNAMKGKLKPITKTQDITVKTNGIVDEESSGGPLEAGTTGTTAVPGGIKPPTGSDEGDSEDAGNDKPKPKGTSPQQATKVKELEKNNKIELATIEKKYFESKKLDEKYKSDILKSDQKFQGEKKDIESNVTIKISTLESTHKTELASIEKQFNAKEISQTEYQSRVLKSEQTFVTQKNELESKSKTTIEALEISHKQEISDIEKQNSIKIVTEEDYKLAILNSELKLIEDNKAIFEKGSAEYAELETKYYQKLAQIGKSDTDIKLKALGNANDAALKSITDRYNKQEISEEQYQAELLAQEMKFLAEKRDLYDKDSAEYKDLDDKYNEKKLTASNKMRDLMKKAAEDLSQAKIDALQEGIDKEKAIEEKSWNEELKGLQDRLIKKQSLSDEEVAYNEKINALIEQKTKEHNQNIANLTASDNLKKQMDKALLLEAEAQNDEQYFAAQLEKARATRDQELLDAGRDAKKIADAKKKYADEEVKITNEAEEKKRTAREKTLETANALISGAANLVNSLMDSELQRAGDNEEKKKKIQKKYANIQFAITASQIITDTASSVMKGFAQLGPIAGAISAALMVATGAIQLGIANRERKNMMSLSEGGYTGQGDKYEPAGIVHKGEYVIPQEGTTNPQVKPVIDIIETARRSDKLSTLDLPSIMAATSSSRSYASGGYVQPTQSVQTIPSVPSVQIVHSQETIDSNNRLANVIEKLMSWKPKVYTELIKKDLDTLDSINKNRNL